MKRSYIINILLICAITLIPSSCIKKHNEPSEYFKKYVLDTIPNSVMDIKVDQTKDIGGYAYVFRFNINRSDMNLIIESLNLNKVLEVEYNNGFLRVVYAPSQACTMIVYDHFNGQNEPSWFNLEQWENPEAYMIKKDTQPGFRRIIIYKEEENHAYFYTYLWTI